MDELDKLKEKFQESNSKERQYGQEVPSGYFEDLEQKILLGSTQKKTQKVTPIKSSVMRNIWRVGSVAAAVMLVFVGVNHFMKDQSQEVYSEIIDTDFETEYFIETEDLYTEDLLEMEGIDEVLSELEEQLKN